MTRLRSPLLFFPSFSPICGLQIKRIHRYKGTKQRSVSRSNRPKMRLTRDPTLPLSLSFRGSRNRELDEHSLLVRKEEGGKSEKRSFQFFFLRSIHGGYFTVGGEDRSRGRTPIDRRQRPELQVPETTVTREASEERRTAL